MFDLENFDNGKSSLLRAWAIFNYHFHNNINYRNFLKFNGNNIPWHDIPVIRKKDFISKFYENLEGKKLKYHFNKTSGSSGFPFKVVKDKYCHAMTWAFIDSLYSQNGISYGKSKQARFYGIPLNFRGKIVEKLKDILLNRVRFSVYNLNDDYLLNIIAKFRAYKFDYAYGYTSVLVMFSRYLLKNNLNIKEICPSLKLIICTSETCTAADKKLIEQAFGVRVLIEYGASELDVLAFTNEYGELEINELTIYMEVLDMDKDILAEDGVLGRIVVTSYFNKALPFIRYEVGDLGCIEKSQYTGKRILTKLEGRLNEFILLPSGKIAAGFTLYYLLKDIIYNLSVNIIEYKIIQKSKDCFILEYVSNQTFDSTNEKFISEKFVNYLEEGIMVEFKQVQSIEREKSGKFKHFVTEIDEEKL